MQSAKFGVQNKQTSMPFAFCFALTFLLLSPVSAGDLNWQSLRAKKEIFLGGDLEDIRTMAVIPTEEGEDPRIVYGDGEGRLHVIGYRDERGCELFESTPMRAAIAGVFVADIDANGDHEIVAYTRTGRIAVMDATDYDIEWFASPGQFEAIGAFAVVNVDEDPQLEFVFSATAPGAHGPHVFILDGATYEEEWRNTRESTEHETRIGLAERLLVKDLDGDGVLEIALNSGIVLDLETRRADWVNFVGFGDRIAYADLTGDGNPELIGEYQGELQHRLIRVFDVAAKEEITDLGGR